MSSACVPCATISPRSSTTIRSAFCTVASRCAMTSVVRPCSSVWRPCCTSCSAAASSELVASSKQNRPVGHQRAGDRQALFLPARKRDATLAELGVEALRQALDELRGAGLLARAHHGLAARIGPAITHIFEHARGKDDRLLRHHRDQAARLAGIHGRQLDAADAHRAFLRVVKAQKQREHRRLARARRTDERDPLARGDGQAEALERRGRGRAG